MKITFIILILITSNTFSQSGLDSSVVDIYISGSYSISPIEGKFISSSKNISLTTENNYQVGLGVSNIMNIFILNITLSSISMENTIKRNSFNQSSYLQYGISGQNIEPELLVKLRLSNSFNVLLGFGGSFKIYEVTSEYFISNGNLVGHKEANYTSNLNLFLSAQLEIIIPFKFGLFAKLTNHGNYKLDVMMPSTTIAGGAEWSAGKYTFELSSNRLELGLKYFIW